MNPAVSTKLIVKFATAISIAEGFGKKGPTADCNNPGNLADGDVGDGTIETHGACGAKITKFPTPAAGWQALTRQVTRMFCGSSHVYNIDMSIAQVAIKWSGDPNWGKNVAATLKVPVDTTLRQLIADCPDCQDAGWPNA